MQTTLLSYAIILASLSLSRTVIYSRKCSASWDRQRVTAAFLVSTRKQTALDRNSRSDRPRNHKRYRFSLANHNLNQHNPLDLDL